MEPSFVSINSIFKKGNPIRKKKHWGQASKQTNKRKYRRYIQYCMYEHMYFNMQFSNSVIQSENLYLMISARSQNQTAEKWKTIFF